MSRSCKGVCALMCGAFCVLGISAATAADRVAICAAGQSDWQAEVIPALRQTLGASGRQVVLLTTDEAAEPGRLQATQYDMLVVCDASHGPAPLAARLADYLTSGGKLLVLGSPILTTPSSLYRGQRYGHAELLRQLERDLKPQVLWDFAAPELPKLTHAANNPQSQSTAVRVANGVQVAAGALQFTFRDVSGWDNFQFSLAARQIPAPNTWTTFWAKGQAEVGASHLMLEWRERDGTRWTAVVRLTDQWQFFALPPQAFAIWKDPPVAGRGGTGDVFKPENACALTLGLALSHVPGLRSQGTYQITVDQLGTSPPPADLQDLAAVLDKQGEISPIEGVCPSYKFFPVTTAAQFRVVPNQAVVPQADLPMPTHMFAPHPRPNGTGFGKDRRWRFQPLLEGVDKQGLQAGAVGSLLLHNSPPFVGSAVASVFAADAGFFTAPPTQKWIAALANRLLDGVFLDEGGAQYYASFGDEDMPVGARVSNRGRQAAKTVVHIAIHDAQQRLLWEKSWDVDVPAGAKRAVEDRWRVAANVAAPCHVVTTLARNGAIIDRLEHAVRVWRPKTQPQFMTARDGLFFLGAQPWYAYGLNYMPSSGCATEDNAYFEYWLDAQPYDPEIIQRDLMRVKAIGCNMISAFIHHRSLPSRNLLDLLMRCEDLGLKVNLSLRPGTPMDFQWELMRDLVVKNRLPENDTVIAYDLAWEPFWRGRAARRPFDPLWRQWVERRYQTVAAAEKAWGCAAPRENGHLAGPSDAQVSSDGPWLAMVLDYRRFQNDLLHKRYNAARTQMHSIDPRHLVSFRMSCAGDPTYPAQQMPYEFTGLARAVDFLAPEGYGRLGDWNRVRPGLFTIAYARAAAPGLPVLWAEFGNTIWDNVSGGPDADQARATARFYDDFLKMAYQGGANGIVAWYYPGGYRVGERSDFGLVGPDGAWRPQTEVFHRWSQPMQAPRQLPKADVVIPIEIDRDADGLAGVYRRAAPEFWKVVEAGKRPALKIVGPQP